MDAFSRSVYSSLLKSWSLMVANGLDNNYRGWKFIWITKRKVFKTRLQKSICPEILLGIFVKNILDFLNVLIPVSFILCQKAYFLKHYNRFIGWNLFYFELGKIPFVYIVVMVIAIVVRPLIYIILTILVKYFDVWTRYMSVYVKLYYLCRKTGIAIHWHLYWL